VPAKKRSVRKRTAKRYTSEAFFDVLRKRTTRNAPTIDTEIESRSLDDVTVMMVDSSGFSRKTHAYGIIQFLAVMTHCYDRIIPRLEARGGITLSRNADNIFALFEKPDDAVRAAIDMQQWLQKRNIGKPDQEQYSVCIGINSGTVVRLADNVYGDMVNVAAKIGEDLAAKDRSSSRRWSPNRWGRSSTSGTTGQWRWERRWWKCTRCSTRCRPRASC
jgi:class 3 adenylate cyclase